ncbi:MAG TPA: tetratricopeptide repeat protein [Bryobacteraceae bacterium]|nr:tetratricopeptide repeat protein [Bryobacteraceae bacterium]
MRSLSWWHFALGGGVALAAVLLVYQPALDGPFVFDDQYLPFFSPRYAEQTLSEATRGVRPFLMFSFWVNNRLAGIEPYTYHLWNVLLHFANSLLVFFIVRRLLALAGSQGPLREWMAAFAGAVFLLHPAQTEAVAYVASRSEVLSALFFYSAFAVFLYRRTEAVSWPRSFAVILLYGAAVSTKEHTITLPALLLLTDYFWNPGFSLKGIRRNWRLYAPLAVAAVAGVALVYRLARGSVSAGFSVEGLPWYDYLYTQCRALWVYFRLFLWPAGQNVDYAYPYSRSILDHGAIFGLAGLTLAVAAAVYFRKRYPLAAYGFIAALILFSPTSSVIPIQDAVAERRLYLPMLGLLLMVVEFLRRWKARPVVVAGSLGCVLVALAIACNLRARVWASDVLLWEDSVAKSPHNSRAHFHLAVAYSQQGRCEEASSRFEIADRLGKPDYRLFVDWALAEDCAGRPDRAIEKLKRAVAIQPSAYPHALMGMIYGKQKRYTEALAALETAEKLDPRENMTHFYRGNIYAATGDAARAAQEYRRAIELNPDNEAARRGLARVEAGARRR